MRRPLRAALVGAGGIGHAYAEAMASVDEVDLSFVADIRGDVAAGLGEAYGAEAVADAVAIADPARVDLAVLCTPPVTHEPLAVAFLEAGVPVMCEKPLAPTRVAGQRMLAAAAHTGTPLTMASKFRFVCEVIQARSMVQAGSLGDVVAVEVAFSSRVDMRQRWNSDPAVSGGGVLIDNGTHAFDIVRYVVGPVESVLATTATATPGLPVEDSALALLRTRGGHLASVTVSWSMDRMVDRYLAVFGTEGSLEVSWQRARARLGSSSADVPFGDGYDKIRALAGNLRNTARAIQGTEELQLTPMDAMASVAVVEAAYQSVRSGAWTRVASDMHERRAG